MSVSRIDSTLAPASTDKDSVRAAISRAADRTGVDFSYLLNQAKSESGLNPNARAMTSSASGLYQFIDQTWLGVVKQHGAKHGFGWASDAIQQGSNGRYYIADPSMRQAVFGLRNQAEPSALMAAESAGDNAQKLANSLGRTPNSTDLYFAHFLGPAGASRFLKANDTNGNAAAASLFPREAAVNRGIFYDKSGQSRTLGQVYALMSRKINASGADQSGAPVQMASAAKPGDIVSSLPGSANGDVMQVLGSSDMSPSSASTSTGPSSTDMLAMMGHNNRLQILRPNPEFAKLAYLLLGNDMNDPTVTG